MAKEIELKAHVSHSDYCRKLIEKKFGFPGSSLSKSDRYFGFNQTPGSLSERALLRIRVEQNRYVATRKEKRLHGDGMEENREIEFSGPAEDYHNVTDFFVSLGYSIIAAKDKRGWYWKVAVPQPMTIELVEVGSLGWFLEVEIILRDDAADHEVSEARNIIQQLMKSVGIADVDIEKRYYLDMLG